MASIDYTIKDVEKIVKGIDGEVKKVDVSRLTAPGENYLSLVFRVDFEVEKDGKLETVSTVAKRLPLVRKQEFDFNAVAMKNEILWYDQILRQIEEFGREFDIDTSFYPEYLGSRLSLDPTKTAEADDDSVLLLRNLIPDGYKNEDRFIGFDLTASKKILRTIATFHATPLVIKYKKPELMKILTDYMESCSLDHEEPPPPPPNADGSLPEKRRGPPDDLMFDKLLELPEFEPYRASLEAIKAQPKGPQMWNKGGTEPWKTTVHNDFWVNNIMVKPREGDEPLVKMVDFQFVSYSSYAKDVVFFLLTSVRNDIQKQHFDELLRYYYDQLTSIIEKAQVAELKLSYDDYLKELKEMALHSETCHALFFTTVIFGEKNTAPDILTGEADMFDQLEYMINHMSQRQIEKVHIILELSKARGWVKM